ncbi:methyltransferase, FkbM family [Rhizobiales bacterium GAS113]|nr:methyltransferase, FkbM family [Rhizobiales bacterium GAS113]
MTLSSTIKFLSGFDSSFARVCYCAHQLAGKMKVPHSMRTILRKGVGGRYRAPHSLLNLRPGKWDAWMVHPGYERATHEWLSRRFEGAHRIMFDIGAYCGTFSLRYRHNFSTIFAFEPMSHHFDALVENISLNSASHIVTAVNDAVGKSTGIVRLYIAGDGTHTIIPAAGSSIDCSIVTIDDFMKDHDLHSAEIDLLKADVEGAELDVLKGARSLLQNGAPVLLLEANDIEHDNDLSTYLAQFQYRRMDRLDQRNLIFSKL